MSTQIVIGMTPEEFKTQQMTMFDTLHRSQVAVDDYKKEILELKAQIKTENNRARMFEFLLDLPYKNDVIDFVEKYTDLRYHTANEARTAAVKQADILVDKIDEFELILQKRKIDSYKKKQEEKAANKRSRAEMEVSSEAVPNEA